MGSINTPEEFSKMFEKNLKIVQDHCTDLFMGESSIGELVIRAEAMRMSCEAMIGKIKEKHDEKFVINTQNMVRDVINKIEVE